MVEEITVDDIQIGGTADIRWKRGKAEEIYPAVLQRSRNKDGVIQYRVHYKNWNKRYDEWVALESIMRVYDDDGKVLKSRVPDGASAGPSTDDSADENVPLKPKQPKKRTRSQTSQPEKEEESEPPATRRSTRVKKPVKTPVSVLDGIDSNSEPEPSADESDENEAESPEDSENKEKGELKCAAGCGKDAQPESIYCSVECIMAHTNRLKKSAESPDESPPPLEDIAGQSPERVEPEDEDDSDEEFKPSASKTTPTKKPAKRKVKKKKDNTPVKKVPKPIKENTDDDIDRIMKDLEDLEDSAPIMVLRNGALLTGMAAPRKETLRKFLEDNRIGVDVITKGKKSSAKKIEDPVKRNSLLLSRKEQERKKRKEENRNRIIKLVDKPVAKVAPNFKPEPGANAYRTNETIKGLEKKAEKKAEKEKEKKRRMSDGAETKAVKKDKRGYTDETLLLIKEVKKAQKKGLIGLKREKTDKAKLEGKPELKRRPSDGDRKRIPSESNPSETPPKKPRRESDSGIKPSPKRPSSQYKTPTRPEDPS